jgi:hypothetical protein
MEVWIARVRLVAVLFVVIEVGLVTKNYPSGYEAYAWITTPVFALGALFGAFSRELRGLLPFERVTLVLVERGRPR